MFALMAMTFVAAACGEGQKVGSEKLLEGIEPGQANNRLGARTAPPAETERPLSVEATKKPVTTQTPKPAATPSYFDVALVADSPYYKPGNRITIRKGVTIRVTNLDATPERSKGRSFTDKNGRFHSGLLKHKGQWTFRFDAPGRYEVIDEGLNFATAQLEVLP